MKKKLKLTELNAKELENVKGGKDNGGPCTCGCYYTSTNGISSSTNGGANSRSGRDSQNGGTAYDDSGAEYK